MFGTVRNGGPTNISASVAGGVFILNWSPDVIDLLVDAFQRAGIPAFGTQYREAFGEGSWLRELILFRDPAVIVYDLAPPYERNWRLIRGLRSDPTVASRRLVFTAVNAARATEACDPDRPVFEVVGCRANLKAIVNAVVAELPRAG